MIPAGAGIAVVVFGLICSIVVATRYAYWRGRERGYLEGLRKETRIFEEERDAMVREVIRTGDVHYMNGDGAVRRVETKVDGK